MLHGRRIVGFKVVFRMKIDLLRWLGIYWNHGEPILQIGPFIWNFSLEFDEG